MPTPMGVTTERSNWECELCAFASPVAEEMRDRRCTFSSSMEIEMPIFIQGLGSGLWNSNKKASSLRMGAPQPHTFTAAEPRWR